MRNRSPSTVSSRSVALAITVVVACGGSDDDRPNVTPCERMRDHLVDLRLASVTQDRDAHREVMRRALGSELIESCERSMSEREVTCILDADDPAQAAACAPATK